MKQYLTWFFVGLVAGFAAGWLLYGVFHAT